MIETLDRMGIRPQERRSVILLLLTFLIIGTIAWLMMGPKLLQLQTSRDQYREENKEAANLVELRDTLQMEVETLLAESGMVSDGRQAQKLMEDIESKARRSGLNFTRDGGGQVASRGNQDFEETRRTVSFQSSLVDLVEFLNNVSEGQNMIRVSAMTVQPTVDRQQVKVDLTFVASYPKPAADKSKKGKK